MGRRFRGVGSIFIAAIRRLEAECRRHRRRRRRQARGRRENGNSVGNVRV